MLIHNCLARHVAKWDLWSNFSLLWVMSKLTLIQLWSMRGPKASKDSKGNYSTIVFNFWWEMDSVHRCNFWSKLTILFVVEHTVNSHTLMLNSTWNFFARPQKNSGRITQCLASRSRLPKVYNFWGFSFLRRKLAGFCTDFHELFTEKKKKISTNALMSTTIGVDTLTNLLPFSNTAHLENSKVL